MFLKHRNIIAWILVLIAAVGWVFGQRFYSDGLAGEEIAVAGTETHPEQTTHALLYMDEATIPQTEPAENGKWNDYIAEQARLSRINKLIGLILCLIAVACALVGVFVLAQKKAFLGPDGAAILVMLLLTGFIAYAEPVGAGYFMAAYPAIYIACVFCGLLILRELWGWKRSKCTLSWSIVQRVEKRATKPRQSLLCYIVWFLVWLLGAFFLILKDSRYFLPAAFGIVAGGFGLFCLWKYGSDLNHLTKQLKHLQNGSPVKVKAGAFAQSEELLLGVQKQHEEAVRTAITSERFKVELISNVSHDLRTPLTSILGYSELLKKENLSEEGREQLQRLHLKAGYMNDLVESLFELTKVSSGVMESNKERIDLIRLLEQTIGLLNDRLLAAGLTVRRNYEKEAVPVLTDGARMHQVFANLLGNAIKYALPGTRIYLEVGEEEERVRVRMVNTASYEMDFQADEILQRFARGDKARSTQGSGLGLAIAQTYTESVGGAFRIVVDGDQFSAVVELPKT